MKHGLRKRIGPRSDSYRIVDRKTIRGQKHHINNSYLYIMLPPQIRKEIFWDIEDPDIEKNKQLIIDRVLQYGNLDELRYIFRNYGMDQITDIVKKIAYLDPKTLSFVINYLQIKKENLKCFTKKQSTSQHWS